MILICVVIAALATAPQAQGSECNLTRIISLKCFGKFGEPLIFSIPTSPNTKTSLKKDTDVILKLENYSLVDLHEKYRNHSTFFPNGTFVLNAPTKNDSGEYKMEEHSSDGVLLITTNIQVRIEATVTEPAVSQMCLSPEEMKVICSSEGEELEFILSLDNNSLIQTRSKSTEKLISNITISLYGQLMGNLRCVVQNNVSREQTVIRLRSCAGTISSLSVVSVAVVASISTVLLILAAFLGMKYFNKTTHPIPVNKDDTEDDIVYSAVTVKQHTSKPTSSSHQNAN